LLHLFSVPGMVRFSSVGTTCLVTHLLWLQGSDLRKITTSLTRSLCDQTFILPLHWFKANDFPETATQAIDFGSGGLSGIGPLTARNFEGRGVRVIVLGEKGEGGAEPYGAKRGTYDDRWSNKWTPKLVKTRCVLLFD
jgi:fatty acid synthase subunit alpha